MRGTTATSLSPVHVPLLPFSGCRGVPPTPPSRKAKVARRGVVTSLVELKPLPYPADSLEPHISRHTMEYHWGWHQKNYVDRLNEHIAGTRLEEMPLKEIVVKSYRKRQLRHANGDAAQVFNHEFFWQSMRPGGGEPPSGDLLRLIERDFGSFESLLKELKRVALSQFGSGWAWLTYKANRLRVGNAVNPYPSDEDYKLVVTKTPNSVNPLVWDYDPLLGIDLWEHAYYLDYEDRRGDYISTVLEKLVSWEVVSSRLEMAVARAIERAEEEEEMRQQRDYMVDSGLTASPLSISRANDRRRKKSRPRKEASDDVDDSEVADASGIEDSDDVGTVKDKKDSDDADDLGDEDSGDAGTQKSEKDSNDADDLDNENSGDLDTQKNDKGPDDEDSDDALTQKNENGIVS